ncbi:MAG: calcium/sodium antiporter [Rhodobacteraceae bacterium]|nr:calcium/sodium antiporter [Paracoccaceae bacterium]
MNLLMFCLGLALLLLGGDVVVRGATRLSHRLKISPLFVGIIIVGFGTSLPEIAVNIDAALKELPGLAIGNVIGSNIANVMLILGTAAVICPVSVKGLKVVTDYTALIITTMMFAGFGFIFKCIFWWHGVILLATIAGYVTLTLRQVKSDSDSDNDDIWPRTNSFAVILILLVIGFVTLITGAEFLVRGAIGLSTMFGISEEIIGLTAVAFGTSLPEIAITSIAAWRRNTQLCLGNVIGSNLSNITVVTGITALIIPLPFTPEIRFDLWVLILVSIYISVVLILGKQIKRLSGIILITLYLIYIGIHYL